MIVTVFGGTGFLGRRVVRRLAARGVVVRVATRHPPRTSHGKSAPLMEWRRADIRNQIDVVGALTGADAAVNAVSAYIEKGQITFAEIHERGAERIARVARTVGVRRLVHMSGIGASPESRRRYIKARGRGQALVMNAFPDVAIVRPSMMFGPGDALFSALPQLARLMPVIPLIGGGNTKLQPVYVEDVAEAVARLACGEAPPGIYELGGPDVLTLREAVELALKKAGMRRPLVSVPFSAADIVARVVELMPHPLLSTGQVDLLRHDNLADPAKPGFRELGFEPHRLAEIL